MSSAAEKITGIGLQAMMPDGSSVELPKRLRELVHELEEHPQLAHFELFFSAAATTIDVLGDLEISQYESEDSTLHGEELLDIVRPTIDATMSSVGAFLECVRSLFAVEMEDSDTFDELMETAFGELEAKVSAASEEINAEPEERAREVKNVLQAIGDGLSHEVGRFDREVRQQTVSADRWLLLDQVAKFRGKFRSGVGAMLFLAARVFTDVRREDVIPGYQTEVDTAVALRRDLARMRERILLYLSTIQGERHGAALRSWLQRLVSELNDFGISMAFAHMRASDKRAMLKVRREFSEVLKAPTLSRRTVAVQMDGLARFLESLQVINRRETLMVHDQEGMLRLRTALRSARHSAEHFEHDAAISHILEAMLWLDRLYGRRADLDGFARMMRNLTPHTLSAESVVAVVRVFDALEASST